MYNLFNSLFRSSSAALAIEECGPNYKAVFAKPKHDDGPSTYPTSYPRHVDSKSNFCNINKKKKFVIRFSIFFIK